MLGLGALGFFLIQLLSEDPGWQTIEFSNKSLMSENEIVLNYDLGRGELSATAEKKELQAVYGTALSRAYKLFDARVAHEGVVNLYYINKHPGEVLTVDPDLYAAFALLDAHGDRSVYLAPVQAQYRNLFSCTDDVTAALQDPHKNEETRALMTEMAVFANDPSAVRVELLGSNQLRLTVSEAYLAYAAEAELDTFVDFAWLTNAFVVDTVADELTFKGYTRGYLSSYDGYTRYLDGPDNAYTVRILDRVGTEVFSAATVNCKGIRSLVQLRDYPLAEIGLAVFYGYADGHHASRYVGSDGLYRTALRDLTAYSSEQSCAEVALTLSPIFIADTLDETKLTAMTEKGIFSIWCRDRVIRYTAEELTLNDLYENETIRYTPMTRP